jgi:hypothetical protein
MISITTKPQGKETYDDQRDDGGKVMSPLQAELKIDVIT